MMNDYRCVGWHLVPAGDGGLQYHSSSEPLGYSSSPVTLRSPMSFCLCGLLINLILIVLYIQNDAAVA